MNLPRKLQAGDNVKEMTFKTVNAIIDYLKSQKLIGDNRTVRLSQQTNGVTLTVLQQSSPQNTSSGGGALALGVITNRPPSGFGVATYRTITVNDDGSWVASGDDIPVVIPEF